MKCTKLLLILLFSLSISAIAQQKYTISGNIKDKSSGEDLLFASVFIEELTQGTTTNEYGFYSITIPKGKYKVRFSFIGYQSIIKEINLTSNNKINIELSSDAQQLEEVTVTAKKKDANVTRNEIGVVEIPMQKAKTIPVLLGEQDILKTIQLMPGVSAANEGGSGFHVRGGSADQNLILLDEAPVFNASHLMGFFSVFNSDAIKDMKMYKGGVPAQYGGRASSVLDLRMKDGNQKGFHGNGGLGLISSRLTLEAPIVKNKGAFIISGRRTYVDQFTRFSKKKEQRNVKLYFYDLNMKANYKINDKNRIFISGYLGRDVLKYKTMFGLDWGNKTATVRWNHLFNEKLFLNTTAVYSDYNYELLVKSATTKMTLGSGIEDFNFKQDYSWFMDADNTIKFGFNSTYRTFSPGKFSMKNEKKKSVTKIQERKALESGLYISNDQNIGKKLKLNYGIRYSIFNVLGGGEYYDYDKEGNHIGGKKYKSGKIVKTYTGFEPRFNATYIIAPSTSVKASYNKMYQYVHLMSNTTSGSPTDYWIPSSKNIKPQITDQVSLGIFQNLFDNNYEFSAEVYYKDFKNMIEYRNGAEIVLNEHIEGDLLYGKGESYGIEFLAKKSSGKFNGWISYTLSKTHKKFDEIDNGKWFSAKYDRTHDLAIVASYKISKKWLLSANWIFKTGNAVTFPIGKYETDGYTLKQYSTRNGFRMPDYHRLDIGATYTIRKSKRYTSELNFSLYNAYGRKNAYAINFRQNENDPSMTEAVKISLFTYIPSITWNFKF